MSARSARSGDGGVAPGRAEPRGGRAVLARTLVDRVGGRFSTQLGIDVDRGEAEVERWFVASTLFGTRISVAVAERTFAQLDRAGITRITQAGERAWDELVALLDAGGYTRYDFRTATRLQDLARAVTTGYGGTVAEIGRRHRDPAALAQALDDLPGWGPVTVGLFLRELRGVWPGARPPLDRRALAAGRHLGLLSGSGPGGLSALTRLAGAAGCDRRDLEAALVRASLARSHPPGCPGGPRCPLVADPPTGPIGAGPTRASGPEGAGGSRAPQSL